MRRRFDDEAVSAAIATVLLFAGVLAIISGMMVTITPVINEKHGSVERQAMAGQMSDLAAETVRISETGLPGDSATLPLRPHSGDLGWNFERGGTWYSVSFVEGGSLRLDDLLDLDDSVRFRYPTGEVSSICFSDLRASNEALWNYRIPSLNGTILATPITTLQQPLDATTVTHLHGDGTETEISLRPGETLTASVSSENWIKSDGPLKVLFTRGEGGATVISPDLSNPNDGLGRSWTIPLPTGSVSLYLVSNDLTRVNWVSSSSSGDESSIGSPSTWSTNLVAEPGEVMQIHSSAPARLLMVWGDDTGSTIWPDDNGRGVGISYTLPAAEGSILVENAAMNSVAIEIDGLYNTVPSQGSTRISWTGANHISATGPVTIHWLPEDIGGTYRTGSIEMIPATDSGMSSGLQHSFSTPTSPGEEKLIIQPASPETSLTLLADLGVNETPHIVFNDTIFSHVTTLSPTSSNLVRTNVNSSDFINDAPFRIISSAGSDGMMEVNHDGHERCLPVGHRASGWIELTLPWSDLSQQSSSRVKDAWNDGTHPLGIGIQAFGPNNGDPYHTLASAWGAHLPRLNYVFKSSITGMEIGYRGGFVGTNHPEFQPDVLTLPPAREGPGPRLAVTIPLTMPDYSSSLGNSEVDLTVILNQREQLVSVMGYEIRRGWDGPYGAAIAAESSQELSFSSDWLTFPGQIEMLDDYVGWVQLTHTSSEAIYHASGEPVLFNLQLSQLTISTEVVG
ncbi:MAG: hypothetical protein CMA77_04030 [Euryarchaeota archaeon]|nr:hypothetical protein [Euryarchaeota archaeon]